jgi:hypothetical protein
MGGGLGEPPIRFGGNTMNCRYTESDIASESGILKKCFCLALAPGEACRYAYLVDANRYELDDYADQSDADYNQERAIAALPLPLRVYYAVVLSVRALREAVTSRYYRLQTAHDLRTLRDIPF